jgi:hypothetical protein
VEVRVLFGAYRKGPHTRAFSVPEGFFDPACGIALKTRLKTKGRYAELSRAQIAERIALLQAELEDADGGVYEDEKTSRWFIVMRPPGATKTTTRRRAPDGSQLRSRDQALTARGQWEATSTTERSAHEGVCAASLRPLRRPCHKAELPAQYWRTSRVQPLTGSTHFPWVRRRRDFRGQGRSS